MRNGLSRLMGIRPSSLVKPKVSLTWVIKADQAKQRKAEAAAAAQNQLHQQVRPEHHHQPYHHNLTHHGQAPPSVPRAAARPSQEDGWSGSSETTRRCRKGHRRCRTPRHQQKFGYQITDLDAFLTKSSIETPGNIPVVLSTPCLLYQTQAGGYQEELSLPLGMVVNAVFKNRAWLYVQTPHGEEGYVRYTACLPLGILPPPPDSPHTAVWESQSDVFPKPTGNRTAAEDRAGTRSECGSRAGQRYKRRGGCGEESVDSLYLAAQEKSRRQVLLVIGSDYGGGKSDSILTVSKGEVVTLLSSKVRDWFWVRARDGKEGFIPAAVAGHGFL